MVEYTPGYIANHWCTKGHILLCLEGELHTELQDGRTFVLTRGMSYQLADDAEPHPLVDAGRREAVHRGLSALTASRLPGPPRAARQRLQAAPTRLVGNAPSSCPRPSDRFAFSP